MDAMRSPISSPAPDAPPSSRSRSGHSLPGGSPRLAPALASVESNATTAGPPPDAESVRAGNLLQAAFPDQRGTPAVIVLRDARGLTAADLAEVRRISDALAGPRKPPAIRGVISLATTPRARGTLLSADGTTTMILVPIAGAQTDPAFGATVDRVRAIAGTGRGALQIRVTGPAGIIRDAVKVFASANIVLLLVTVALILVLLLAIYRSPLLALLPLLAVGLAIQVTDAVGALLARAGLLAVDAQSAAIMTVLLFGAGTDYCLFIVARYREHLRHEPDPPAAMGASMRRVGEAIVSSAATVVAALLALLLATLPALRVLGPFLALGIVVMLAAGPTLAPALVVLAGRAAFWPWQLRVEPGRADTGHSVWRGIARLVGRRPAATALAALALLAVPSTGLRGYRESYNFITGFRVALGEDYNIFVTSRIREEARAHGVAEGTRRALTRTGGVITSAGLILAGTFAVLATQPIRELFQFGVAMGIGILLDVVVVRGALVPAIVLLLGRWNWWLSRLTPPAAPGLPVVADPRSEGVTVAGGEGLEQVR